MAGKTRWGKSQGFSLVELLVAMAVLSLILLMIMVMLSATERSWKHFSSNTQAFQNARLAFDTMNRTLSEATLNTYYDYYNSGYSPRTNANTGTFVPAYYGRYSELHFISGKQLVALPLPQVTHSVFFQTPVSYSAATGSYGNLTSLLNAVGFYIDFTSDTSDWPTFFSSLTSQPAPRYRYRLIEFLQPTEQLSVYSSLTGTSWFTTPLQSASPPTFLLADNIIACVICPHLAGEMTPATPTSSLTTTYEYDSRVASSPWTSGSQPVQMNQLPPLLRVVLIAVDEPSMLQIQGSSTAQPSLGFNYANVFQNPANLKTDITTVTSALAAKHVNYHVFQTDVPIRSANWSQ